MLKCCLASVLVPSSPLMLSPPALLLLLLHVAGSSASHI
jgi:hypothetical protein